MTSEIEKLDEIALRKPGFREGLRVRLADGQEWALPPLLFESFPEVDATGTVVLRDSVPTYGPEHDRDLDVLLSVGDVDPDEHFRASTVLAANLLRSNYELTSGDLRSLLVWRSDGSTTEMWADVIAGLQGFRPKPSAGGSD